MRDGTREGCRNNAHFLSTETFSPESEELGLGSGPGFFALQAGQHSRLPGGCTNPQKWKFRPVHSPFYQSGWAPGWKIWYPPDPLVLPSFCHCPGSWVLIPADASGMKTHIRHPVAEHSTKPGEIKSICMNSCEGGEYLTLLFINNSLALTCLNKWSNKVKCRSQRLTNMKICSLTGSLPSAAGFPNLCG
ncbi:hypothetical protein HJG60_010655 [Phyllostomus discolor]|uniref:Uncharacterized protein n=1 Tax=Phyllostomus discolor TaxID=89673 RepID=A0A834ART0_9CHIR|nr:hypothetical protein HJG60_010655 [Phyllostomus discolor]